MEIVRLQAQVVHCAPPRPARRLIVDVDEAPANAQPDHAYACNRFVPDLFGIEHRLQEVHRGCRVGGEDVNVVEADVHRRGSGWMRGVRRAVT